MRPLTKRVGALEERISGAAGLHIISVKDGQTKKQAVAAYEAANGKIAEGPNVLQVIINPY